MESGFNWLGVDLIGYLIFILIGFYNIKHFFIFILQGSNQRVRKATERASNQGTVRTISRFGTGRREAREGSGWFGRTFTANEDQLLPEMPSA